MRVRIPFFMLKMLEKDKVSWSSRDNEWLRYYKRFVVKELGEKCHSIKLDMFICK